MYVLCSLVFSLPRLIRNVIVLVSGFGCYLICLCWRKHWSLIDVVEMSFKMERLVLCDVVVIVRLEQN